MSDGLLDIAPSADPGLTNGMVAGSQANDARGAAHLKVGLRPSANVTPQDGRYPMPAGFVC